MLLEATALTRRIVGNAAGTYSFHSVLPTGGSLALENVLTSAGQADVLAVSADANQVRFTPAAEKSFGLTLSRMVGTQARAISIAGTGGGPAADVDVTLSPDLSLLRERFVQNDTAQHVRPALTYVKVYGPPSSSLHLYFM